MLVQWSASRLCSRKTCFTKSPIFRKLFFHHECRVFCTWPILPLYFCSREYCPLTHLHVTSLSPHSCTVSPSSRVWMVASAGPFFFCERWTVSHCRGRMLRISTYQQVYFSPFLSPKSSLPVQSVAILSQTFPRMCHLHLCFHLV